VARLDRLLAAMEGAPNLVRRLNRVQLLTCDEDIHVPDRIWCVLEEAHDLLVAVRDITEGR
jgi:hypothetical protein